MKTASKFCIVLVTAGGQRNALLLTNLLIKNRLAACVNTIPIQSTFRWKGKIQKTSEKLMIIKTRKSHVPQIEKLIKKYHTYDTPEILTIPLLSGESRYLKWLETETTKNR